MAGQDGHYFDEEPTAASHPEVVDLALPDLTLRLTTDRGVFGHGRVDAGTRLLLQRGGSPRAEGVIVDLGCGTGAIAVTTALRSPAARVLAIDVNERARALCRANADANGVTNLEVLAPDEVPDDLRVEEIWSNPPIRIGKPALHRLLLDWLQRLSPEGQAHLVVHKHLGSDSLQRWLTSEGWTCRRVLSSGGYRILVVSAAEDRPRP